MFAFWTSFISFVVAHYWALGSVIVLALVLLAQAMGWIALIPIVGPVIDGFIIWGVKDTLTGFLSIVSGIGWLLWFIWLLFIFGAQNVIGAWLTWGAGWILYQLLKCIAWVTGLASSGWTGGYWFKFGSLVIGCWNVAWQFIGVFCHAWFVAGCLLAVLQNYLFLLAIDFVKWCKSNVHGSGN